MARKLSQPALEALERRMLFSGAGLLSTPLGGDTCEWIELDYRGDGSAGGSIASATDSRSFGLVSPRGGRTTLRWQGSGGNLDPYLHVFDARGRCRFASSDLDASPGAAGQVQLSLRGGATYYIVAGGLAGTTGDFQLTVDAREPKLARIRLPGPGQTFVRRGRIRRPGKAKYFRFRHSELDDPEASLSCEPGGDVTLQVWHDTAGTGDGPEAAVGAKLDRYCYLRVSGTSGRYDLNVVSGESIFVAPDARRRGRGTYDDPFPSLEEARQGARALIAEGLDKDVTVYIRGGRYQVSRTVEFGPEDSGDGMHWITYMAFPGETPVFSGGHVLSPGWTHVGNGIYRANVGRRGFRQLYVNGRRAQRAESEAYCIRGYERLREGDVVQTDAEGHDLLTGRVLIRASDLAGCGNVVGAELHLKRVFASHVLRVAGVDTDVHPDDGTPAAIVALRLPSGQAEGLEAFRHRALQDYYTLQGRPFLDSPGEWWQDGGKLYYMPRAGEDLGDSEFVVPAVETLVRMNGTSNIRLDGIVFEHTAWDRPGREGFLGQQAGFYETSTTRYWGAAYHPPAGVSLRGGTGVCITNCTFRHFGGTGLAIGAGSRDVTVYRCVIDDVSGNGVNVDDYSNDRWHLAPLARVTDVRVTNSRITRFGQEFHGSVGVFIGPARSVLIDHNEVAYGPSTGISMGFYTGIGVHGDIVVSRNDIHHVMAETGDGGAVYATGATLTGSRVEANYVHDMIVSESSNWAIRAHAGVYLEPSTSGITVSGNVLDVSNPAGFTPALYIWGDHVVGENYTSPDGHEDIVADAGPRV